jgi:hypothetical protein
MTVRKGPKGKYFTDVVRKIPVRASIRTIHEIIQGTIHIHPEQRTLDALNEDGGFLAVTDAEIEAGPDIIETDFVAVNKAHILWVNPVEDDGENRG